ncbi:MAG TPA: hypothetical protein EYP10_11005 [Armatimonadetes bacterium]|nr:hypothetical protein [Armatimonadota bacterium]
MQVKVAPRVIHLLTRTLPLEANSILMHLWRELQIEDDVARKITTLQRPTADAQLRPRRVRFNYD